MTRLNLKKISCHICGTKYEAIVISSWNEKISGKMPKDKTACPKCGVPYKPKLNLSVGAEILINIIENKEKAVETLFDFSIDESDVEKYKKMMVDVARNKLEESSEEFLKHYADNLSKDKLKYFKEHFEKQNIGIKKLKKLQENGKLENLIEEITAVVKEKIKEEKIKYSPTK